MTEEFQRWLDLCPLRSWRTRQPYRTQAYAAVQLAVSVNTLRAWEQGVSEPSSENMGPLCDLLGVLPGDWKRWLARRPVEVTWVREEELTRTCTRELFRSPTPKECGGQLTRLYWRGGVVDIHCEDCGIVEQEG